MILNYFYLSSVHEAAFSRHIKISKDEALACK